MLLLTLGRQQRRHDDASANQRRDVRARPSPSLHRAEVTIGVVRAEQSRQTRPQAHGPAQQGARGNDSRRLGLSSGMRTRRRIRGCSVGHGRLRRRVSNGTRRWRRTGRGHCCWIRRVRRRRVLRHRRRRFCHFWKKLSKAYQKNSDKSHKPRYSRQLVCKRNEETKSERMVYNASSQVSIHFCSYYTFAITV